MRLRWLFGTLLIHLSLSNELDAFKVRNRRDNSVSGESPSSLSDAKSYKPPLLAAPPASQAVPYQPPLLLASSNDYKPLISSSQTQSIRYQAPANAQGLPSYTYSHSQGYGTPLLASAQTNSGSLNALPIQSGNRQGFSYSGEAAASNQFQSQPLQQAGSKPESGTVSKDGNPNNDEYVVYYYYYYDNDNTTGSGGNKSNNSLNFDDIPSLESYDTDKTSKEPEKSASARTLAANVNSVGAQDAKRLGLSNQDDQTGSQPRSLSGLANQQPPFIRSDVRTNFNNEEPSDAHPLKPVSNVYRYGTNEVPRLPVLPNFVVSHPPSITRSVSSGPTPGSLHHPPDNPTTQPSSGNAGAQLPGGSDHESDDINVVLDQPVESKLDDEKEKSAIEDLTTTTTTTETPTTTEDPTTTTTEKSRRRSGAGNRRRFNPSPASFTSGRRQGATRTTSSTTTSTTTLPGVSSTRGSFRGSNRVRPRPTVASNRPRPSFSRNVPSTSDAEDSTKSPNSTSISTTTVKPKFGVSASGGRRFSSTRTRSQPGATTRNISSTSSPSGRSVVTSAPRTRPSARPRPNNLVSRGRGPRPGFLRPRPGSEPEESETTTTTPQKSDDETSSSPSSSSSNDPSTAEEEDDTDEESNEDTETSETETEEPTTTEKNRFSALFRPRNRNTLNRPRPVVGERSRRS